MVNGKVVIVTGGGKGIGRYVAGTFLDAGAKVVVADFDASSLDEALQALNQKSTEVLGIQADVRDEDQVKKLVSQTVERFGRVDVLINNAAIVSHSHLWPSPVWTEPWPLVRDMSLEFWSKVLETNVTGTFLCSKHVLPHMERQRSGHIITIPGGGPTHKLGVLAYALTKQAVTTFARFLAEEVRESNICVIAMSPGATVATEDAPPEVLERYPGVEAVGNRYVLAAEAVMEMSGHSLTVVDGSLQATN